MVTELRCFKYTLAGLEFSTTGPGNSILPGHSTAGAGLIVYRTRLVFTNCLEWADPIIFGVPRSSADP
jgi:hypothetical protein